MKTDTPSWIYCMCFLLFSCYRNFAVMDDIIDEIKEDFLYLSKDRSMPGAEVIENTIYI